MKYFYVFISCTCFGIYFNSGWIGTGICFGLAAMDEIINFRKEDDGDFEP